MLPFDPHFGFASILMSEKNFSTLFEFFFWPIEKNIFEKSTLFGEFFEILTKITMGIVNSHCNFGKDFEKFPKRFDFSKRFFSIGQKKKSNKVEKQFSDINIEAKLKCGSNGSTLGV